MGPSSQRVRLFGICHRNDKNASQHHVDRGRACLPDQFGIARLFKLGQAKDTVALGSPGYDQLIGVQVQAGGKPVMRRCKIHHGESAGIYVSDQGEGTFEDCETFANKSFGVHIGKGGNPVLRRCIFRDGEWGER